MLTITRKTNPPSRSLVGTALVSAKGIAQGYGRSSVFEGLDLEIERGVVALLGPNGAGKTTLLRTLATIVPAKAGELRVASHLIDSERSARRARRQIGYLPQDFGYLPSYTALDFVRYCAWLRCVPRSLSKAASREALALVGLTTSEHAKMGTLSGGMLRRAGIAAAIVGDPAVVLLDEPTVGLDPAQRLDFREMIRGLSDSVVVLSTHLVEDVGAVCDSVVVLTEGSIRFRGTPLELAAAGTNKDPGDSPLERGYMSTISAARVIR